MSVTMVMTVEEMQDRSKWLEMRKTGIGGSDASVIVGLNPWKSKFELWLDKTNQAQEVDKPDNEYIYWGNVQEELVANRFCELTGKKVRRCGMLRNNEHPFMLADIDRLVVGENAILECKTTASWNSNEWEGDNLPDAYYIQVQHYLAVGGYDKAYIACLVGGNKFVWKEIPRNDEEIEVLIKAEEEFWQKNVIEKALPEVDGSSGCSKAIALLFKGDPEDEEAAELEGKYDILCRDLNVLKEEKKKLEKVIDEKENQIRVALGNKVFGRSPKYNFWYKIESRSSFDSAQFQRDFPELYEKYKKTSSFRKLRFKESKARKDD